MNCVVPNLLVGIIHVVFEFVWDELSQVEPFLVLVILCCLVLQQVDVLFELLDPDLEKGLKAVEFIKFFVAPPNEQVLKFAQLPSLVS